MSDERELEDQIGVSVDVERAEDQDANGYIKYIVNFVPSFELSVTRRLKTVEREGVTIDGEERAVVVPEAPDGQPERADRHAFVIHVAE